jgi:hypothetical protein
MSVPAAAAITQTFPEEEGKRTKRSTRFRFINLLLI